MKEYEYKELKRRFRAEYEKKLEALEIVYRASRDRGEPLSSPALEPSIAPNGATTLAGAIKEALPLLPDTFDINDVIALVGERHPDKKPINPTSVSGGLRQLHKRGALKVIEPGRGTKPTIYRVLRKDEQDDA
jgi:hypothetical protein